MNRFRAEVEKILGQGLAGVDLDTLQVNVGLKCNQECIHCHLQAGPGRTEVMEWSTMAALLEFAQQAGSSKVDITGGSPELNPDLRRFIAALRSRDHDVMVRTNLTILLEPDMGEMADFYRDQQVELTASLPCYLEEEVREQRGRGVFEKSIKALKLLNSIGYGEDLPLNLVYNPLGAFLPPPQKDLEEEYRDQLRHNFDISFTRLFTIANMPIGRFLYDLKRKGQYEGYSRLLEESFNPSTLDSLMCRHQINVGWDGRFYDCDFNQALGLDIGCSLPDRPAVDRLRYRGIVTGNHCFGCTAGAGSSCGGSLVE